MASKILPFFALALLSGVLGDQVGPYFKPHPFDEVSAASPALPSFQLGNATSSLGRTFGGRIFNGFAVRDRRKYSFMAVLYADHGFCGGSLIADNVVLSAAHCFGLDKKVYVGYIDDDDDEVQYESFGVLRQIVHSGFAESTYDNDYMISILDGRSSFRPICLPPRVDWDVEVGTKLRVLGFGLTAAERFSESLLETEVEYISTPTCSARFYHLYDLTPNMLCCDSSLLGRDACDGDSGGPLFRREGGEDVLVGIISWGIDCAVHPGVYARVARKINWIRSVVDRFGGKLPDSCAYESEYERPAFPHFFGTTASDEIQKELPEELAEESDAPATVVADAPVAVVADAPADPNCVDERSFPALLGVSRTITGDRCAWAARDLQRCQKINVASGRKFREHCPRSCRACDNAVLDNRLYRNRFCQREVRGNKWQLCRNPKIRANCPVTCSCVRRSYLGTACGDYDAEKCRNVPCDTDIHKKNCPQKCGLCRKIHLRTCPIRDAFASGVGRTKVVCRSIPGRGQAYRQSVCRSPQTRSQCPRACASVPYE